MKDSVYPIDEPTKSLVVEQLKQADMLKFGDFTLKSGAKSNFYLDLRMATMEPIYQTLVEVVGGLVKYCIDLEPDNKSPVALIGMPYGAVPIAASVAQFLKLKYYPVRKETKAHGIKLDENLYKDYRFILIEDTMTTGGSVMEVLENLSGKKVTDLVVIADRRESQTGSVESRYPNIRVHSVIKKANLIKD